MCESEQPATRSVCFLVKAFSEPGLLPRILSPFARRGLELDVLRAVRCGVESMNVELSIDRIPSEMVHLIEGNLNQIIGVVDVTVEYRSPAPQL